MAQLDTTELGSVGTVVGAVMETAGHFMQSAFIDLLENGLATSLGAFLYLVAVISALTIIALGGKYKFGRWFLFGPILFYALVFVRVDSCGVVVRHGDRVVSPEVIWDKTKGLANIAKVDAAITVLVPENGNLCEENPARISAVFEIWNNLTSSVINGLVKLLRLDQRGSDFDFVTKVDRFANLFAQGIDDPIVQDLVGAVIQTPCGAAFATAHQMMAPNHAQWQKDQLDKNLKAQLAISPINPAEYPRVKQMIDTRATKNPDLDNDQLLSCQELWGLAIDVLQTNATSIVANIAKIYDAEDSDQRSREALVKLSKKYGISYNPETKKMEFVKEKEALIGVINEKAVRLFLDRLRQLNPSLRKGELNASSYKSLIGDVGGPEELADAMRSSSATEEFREKGRFLQIMLGLPYAQGILLYFLAMLYPFFCVFGILPGRHETVMMWFGLWFWVKLWDFGFAVVMLIDELMYTLLPHSPFLDDATLADPAAAMKSVLSIDPSYSVHIYYNIMASCLAAVPILTAGAVRKGTGPLLSVVNKGFTNFLGNPGGAFASYAGNMKTNANMAQARKMQHNMLVDSLYRHSQDPNVSHEMIAATAMRAGAALMNGDVGQVFGQLANRAAIDAQSNPAKADLYHKLQANFEAGKDWVGSIAGKNPVGAAMAAYFDAKGDQAMRKAWADHAYMVATDVYRQSTWREIDYLNADARQQGYYDHPFRAPYSDSDYMNVISQENFLEWRKATGAFMDSAINGPINAAPSVINALTGRGE